MTIPVYFENRLLILTDNLDAEINNGFDALHEFFNYGELKQFIEKFQNNKLLKRGILFGSDTDLLLSQLKACFIYVDAAGGVVENTQGKNLFIYRRGKWDLPKGKCEKGETVEETAKREVMEECGLRSCSIKSALAPTFHTYEIKNKWYLKKTYWFKMNTNEESVKPQLEEDITKAEWVGKSDMKRVKENTYPSVLDVMRDL